MAVFAFLRVVVIGRSIDVTHIPDKVGDVELASVWFESVVPRPMRAGRHGTRLRNAVITRIWWIYIVVGVGMLDCGCDARLASEALVAQAIDSVTIEHLTISASLCCAEDIRDSIELHHNERACNGDSMAPSYCMYLG